MICTYLQRDHEITELVITDHRKAHMDDEPTSHHTEVDHKYDCWGSVPCGGCWSCMVATVRYREARRG